MVFGDPALLSIIPIFNKTQNIIGIVGGVANNIPNGDYPGNDEIDESYATYWFINKNNIINININIILIIIIIILNELLNYFWLYNR